MKKLLVLSILLFCISNIFAQTEEDEWNSYLEYFGRTLADSLENNDVTLFNKTFNIDLFIDKFLVKKEDENIKEFNDGFVSGFKEKFNLGEELAQYAHGSYYDFVNSYTSVDDEIHMIFRLIDKEGGLNYHDFEVVVADTMLQFIDAYYYTTGQKSSVTIGELYKDILKESLNKKFGSSKKDGASKALINFTTCNNLIEAMQYKSAMSEFMQIPEEHRQKRIFKFLRIHIAENLSDEEYVAAVTDFNKSFPNDPSFYFYTFDKALVNEEYDKALKYLNKLDISVGLDPFLDYYRGLIYFIKEDYKQAEEKLEVFLNKFYWEDGTDLLLNTYLLTDQKTKAVTLLNSYINSLGYTKEGVVKWTKETHPEFSKSPEFLHWEKSE